MPRWDPWGCRCLYKSVVTELLTYLGNSVNLSSCCSKRIISFPRSTVISLNLLTSNLLALSTSVRDLMLNCDHTVVWEDFSIIGRESNHYLLETKESLFINRDNLCLNRNKYFLELFEIMKNDFKWWEIIFILILEALFKFLSWVFDHVEKTAWSKR